MTCQPQVEDDPEEGILNGVPRDEGFMALLNKPLVKSSEKTSLAEKIMVKVQRKTEIIEPAQNFHLARPKTPVYDSVMKIATGVRSKESRIGPDDKLMSDRARTKSPSKFEFKRSPTGKKPIKHSLELNGEKLPPSK